MKYTEGLLPNFGREDQSMFRATVQNLSPVSCTGPCSAIVADTGWELTLINCNESSGIIYVVRS